MAKDWILFKDQSPKIGQKIEVHTFSDLYLETVYDTYKDLEGICSEWRSLE